MKAVSHVPPQVPKRRRRITLVLVYLCIAVLGYGLGSYLKYDRNPETCASCHIMKPQVMAWQLTAHSTVPCRQCHQDISLLTYKFRHRTGRYRLPVQVDGFMSDEICLQCHNPKRIVTPPGDLLIPHTLHMTKGIDCIDCHRNVVHANVNQLIMKQKLNPGDINLEQVKQLTSYGNRIPMDKCMECHNGAKAPRECNVCHSDKQIPDNHRLAQWSTQHGKEAFKNIGECNDCHEYDVSRKANFKPTGDPLTDVRIVARGNAFCANCHLQRPETHRKPYSVYHPQRARQFAQGCLACHNREKGEEVAVKPTTDIYCSQCHFQVHEENWVLQHRVKVKEEGDQKCYQCHDASSCGSCHRQARKL
ncbi:cytochrome c3 family protein [Calderihabitans maritimus]|uniref:Cytochrome c, NapC/NirT family n=1 Tax=Calderihabitans maritimus TaxID=1246530 RepID=A0A1Z5HPJ5_9FIRM|nr:cytochrome c3 family protein [Calderihabitans maritimus]GAW91449.1 cytochrome c, NapC/NirT family [Calderihabitans maritimus]